MIVMKFKITIEEEMFGQFEAEVSAASEEEAREAVKEVYAEEFGTFPDLIKIVSIESI
jgi:hypothetical protein